MNGEEVMIVREKVWQKSMARLLRRDEDDDVNGIKRIVTGGLIELIETESRRGSVYGTRGTGRRGGGFAVGATTPRPSHESSRTSISGGRSHAGRTTPIDGDRPPYERNPTGARVDVAPPPYIGQPANEGTHTTSSSGGTGTMTTTTTSMSMSMSNPNDSPLVRNGTIGSTNTNTNTSRPLPLAPPQIERVVERKMDEMAGGTNTMDAYTATRLGLGPVIGGGTEVRTMESIVDQKMDSFNQSTTNPDPGPGPSAGTSGMRETMEQLVDRKITFAGNSPGPSTSAPTRQLPSTPSHLPPRIHATSYNAYKGKAAEAGFHIQNQTSPTTFTDSPINTTSTSSGSRDGEMSLEEMIELKMAALRASKSTTHRPVAVETHSGGVKPKRRRRKGKGRERAESDPGPKLERFESDDDSGDG